MYYSPNTLSFISILLIFILTSYCILIAKISFMNLNKSKLKNKVNIQLQITKDDSTPLNLKLHQAIHFKIAFFKYYKIEKNLIELSIIISLLKDLIFSLLLITFLNFPFLQTTLSLIILVVNFILEIVVLPYKLLKTNLISLTNSLSLIIIFICVLIIQLNELLGVKNLSIDSLFGLTIILSIFLSVVTSIFINIIDYGIRLFRIVIFLIKGKLRSQKTQENQIQLSKIKNKTKKPKKKFRKGKINGSKYKFRLDSSSARKIFLNKKKVSKLSIQGRNKIFLSRGKIG